MIIISAFTDNNIPKEGLTPLIKIRDVSDSSIVVNNAEMAEIGDGFYKYDFEAYDSSNDYSILVDGGEILTNPERYQFGTDSIKSDMIINTNRFNLSSAKIEDNVLIVYDDEGTIQEWDLKDADGGATSVNVYQRIVKD
jgi:hypothetical protein